jgi:hypothetical protein
MHCNIYVLELICDNKDLDLRITLPSKIA